MTGPGDHRAAAGGRGHMRASHADREQVIEVLKNAFVQGRLTKGEMDARVGQAFASRTHAELARVTADIPAEPVVPASRRAVRAGRGGGLVIAAAAVITAGLWAVAVASDSAALGLLSLSFSFTCLGVVLLVGAALLDSQHRKRSGGQPPRRRTPHAGGPAPRRAAPAAGAYELPPGDQPTGATAEAAPRRPFRPRNSAGCAAEALFRSRSLRAAGQLP
jgi:Domain of unknown function (DUF1707)